MSHPRIQLDDGMGCTYGVKDERVHRVREKKQSTSEGGDRLRRVRFRA